MIAPNTPSQRIKSPMIALDTPEPHKVRRQVIQKEFPEVKDLQGPAAGLKWIILGEVVFQL